jgi:hypothetical protein
MRPGDDSLGAGREEISNYRCAVLFNTEGLSPASEPRPFAPCRGKRPLGFVPALRRTHAKPRAWRDNRTRDGPHQRSLGRRAAGRKMRPMARSSPTRHNRRGCLCWRGRREPEHTGMPEHNVGRNVDDVLVQLQARLRLLQQPRLRSLARLEHRRGAGLPPPKIGCLAARWGPWAWINPTRDISGHGALCLLR